MQNKMLLTARLDQRLMMNQQLKQAIALLQYSTIELKQAVLQQLDQNPLVEIQEEAEEEKQENFNELPHYVQQVMQPDLKSKSSDEFNYIENIAGDKKLHDHLIDESLNAHFTEQEQVVAQDLINSIDDDGYFAGDTNQIAEQYSGVTVEMVERVLRVIQSFEPCGVGARTTKECLLIQLAAYSKDSLKEIAQQIIETDMLTIESFDLNKLMKQLKYSEEEIIKALELIYSFDFHPGRQFGIDHELSRDPELYVKKIGEKWHVFLNNSFLNRIEINKEYSELIKKNSRDKEYKTVLEQLNQAQALVSGLQRRNQTLLQVASYLVEQQQEFIEHGDCKLKSMNMADVANALDFHESTISRITTGKYIATPKGVYELKHFFPSSLKTVEGDSKSSSSVKELLKEIVAHEQIGAIYSDDALTEKLKENGVQISRRTVAKYRDELNIPSSYVRASVKIIKKLTEDDYEFDNESQQLV